MITTKWGYDIDADYLPDLLTIEEFNCITGNKYLGDQRIIPNLQACQSAIREYVGWHLYNSLSCEIVTRFHDLQITRERHDLLIQIPSRYLTVVDELYLNAVYHDADDESQGIWTGDTFDTYVQTNGVIRVYDIPSLVDRKSKVYISFKSGLTDLMMNNIKELIAHRITHALCSSNGITSETAGGLSVTYNANWINSARSTNLPDDNKEVLEPYRVRGVY